MTDLRLDPITNDLAVEHGDLDLTATSTESIAQELHILLRTMAGEWFLDPRLGIPYFTHIFGQKPHKLSLSNIFREAILSHPLVKSIPHIHIEFDNKTSTVTMDVQLVARDGTPVSLKDAFTGAHSIA